MAWRYQQQPKTVGVMLRLYKRAFAHLKADPQATVKMAWNASELNLAQFRDEFVRALNCRINDKVEGGDQPRGRKDSMDEFYRFCRDSRAIRERIVNRLIVRQFETKEARERFGHLLTSWEDE